MKTENEFLKDHLKQVMQFDQKLMPCKAELLSKPMFTLCSVSNIKDVVIDRMEALSYHRAGNKEARSGELKKAIEYYTEAIEYNYKHSGAYYGRARAYFRLGLYKKALDDFTEAIRYEPGHAGAYDGRGEANVALKNTTEAENDFNKAVGLYPKFTSAPIDSASPHFNLGKMHIDLEKYKEALDDFNEGLVFDPENTGAQNLKNICLSKLGTQEKK